MPDSRPNSSTLRPLSRLRRIQRATLFGGGIVLSLALLALTALTLWSSGKAMLSDRQQVFDAENTALKVILRGHAIDLYHQVSQAEANWKAQIKASPALTRQFDADQGQAWLPASSGHPLALALGPRPGLPAATRLGPYLALAEQTVDTLCGGDCELRKSETAYLYSPDRQFLTIASPLLSPLALTPPGARARLRQEVFTGMPSPAVPTANGQTSRNPAWLATAAAPLTGRPAIRLAQTAVVDGIPFAVFARDIRIDTLLNTWRPDVNDETTLLASPSDAFYLGFGYQAAQGSQLIATLRKMALPALNEAVSDLQYRDGLFILRARLPAPAWIHIQVFAWHALLNDLRLSLITNLSALLFALSCLWILILLLDRRIFKPAFSSAQRIFESENLNRIMVDTAPSGLTLLSIADGTVLLENEVMRQWARQGCIARPPLHLQLLDTHQTASPLGTTPCHRDIQFALADGNAMELHSTTMATRYQGIRVLLCNVVDITARKALERQLESARQTAEAASQAKSSFVAMVSHEIRTPLHAIVSSLDLLGRARLAAPQQQRLAVAKHSSQALLAIINDILDLSKVEAGLMSVESIPFDLAALGHEASASMEPLARAKGLEFSCMIDAQLAPAYLGDPGRVRQIMLNLLGNAIKFTLSGEVQLEIYLQDDSRADSPVIIGVSDSGVGIPAEYHDQVFTEFSQADASITRRFGGTGLGLSLCKKLAELLAGTIEFTSSPGVGSTFVVTLPLPPCAAAPIAAQPAVSPGPASPAARILVVDDHPAIRALIQDQLRELGYQADIAANGAAALALATRQDYALVLTDLSMPDISGYSLARALRDNGFSAPIVAITAQAGNAELPLCAQAGIDELMLKPFTLEELDGVIRKHLALRPASVRPPAGLAAPLPAARRAELLSALDHSIQLMRQALERMDQQVLMQQLHATKGAFAMAGQAPVAQLCAEIEQLVQAGRREETGMRLDKLAELAHARLAQP
ncbi:two-component system capsular synthesis sensor histidine kinase RcsC [Chromobacterium alkanivorans]|uniref:ATP-binding protein n=1 Tax=Chromobacterium alkanivorans TaxID=1071719 RepID=UPI00216A4C9D|nr:ATP-binding protein [Chromobacterium alkanivorans]MCS3804063.1 two-component system capsular synthesis sensor histidine kinase RcsC [Chromobacterium alkanivorans]MCS3818716.1 two-component system capsular synthesis sensor histidine kinase RcsC [Chromobacterium alkanivorans]MCS3876138.1 two-component system capsular synthesis sensor histidine kinase RcsC [Chromobacterium alkanivorans]